MPKNKPVEIRFTLGSDRTISKRREETLRNLATATVGIKRNQGNVSGLMCAIGDLDDDAIAFLAAAINYLKNRG